MTWGSCRRIGKLGMAAAPLCLQACSASPSQDILGSFFPSWLLCACLGLVATALARWVLVVLGIDRFVPFVLVTYTAMALSVSCLIWLIRFGN